MKIKSLLWTGSLAIFLACSAEPKYTLQFCDDQQMHTCEPDQAQFLLGKKVYVSLKADPAFQTDKITGTVYKLVDQEKFSMGSKDFDVSKTDKVILQDIPFNEFGMQALGTFVVLFTDAQDQIIASRQLEIIQP